LKVTLPQQYGPEQPFDTTKDVTCIGEGVGCDVGCDDGEGEGVGCDVGCDDGEGEEDGNDVGGGGEEDDVITLDALMKIK